jgi:hypothetical protein
MTVAELKKYLQMRGVTVNGYLNLNLKPALLEIAQAVEKMMLPVEPCNEYSNDGSSEDTLVINDLVIQQPLSYNVVNDFTDSPPFGLYDIFNYLTSMINKDLLLINHLTITDFSTRVMSSPC